MSARLSAACLLLALAVAACSTGAPPRAPAPPFHHLAVAPTFHTYHPAAGPGLVTSIVQDASGQLLVADNREVELMTRAGGGYAFTVLTPPALQAWFPTGLAFQGDLLYVANDIGADVLVLRASGTNLSLVQRITSPTMKRPENVAVDQDGSIVVADTNAGLLRFSAAGTLQWQRPLDGAYAVTISGGNVYATSTTALSVVKVNGGGAIVTSAGSSGVTAGRYERPVGIATAPHGRLVVTDADNGRITTLDQNLRVVGEVGANGAGLDALDFPFATLATSSGYVVADTYKHRLVDANPEWVEQDQIVYSPLVPAGRGRPLVYGTSDAQPKEFPMLPGVDIPADLGLRSPLRFVGGLDFIYQAGSARTPIHLDLGPQLRGFAEIWAQRVGSYVVIGAPTSGQLEVVDPATGMFTSVGVGADSWWRADGWLLLPGNLRRSLADVIAPAVAAFGRAAQLLRQGVPREQAFDQALGGRNWSADLSSPAAKQFLASPRTTADEHRYFAAVLQDPTEHVFELLEVHYLTSA